MESSEILQTIFAGSIIFISLSVIIIKTVTQYKTKQKNFLLEKKQMESDFERVIFQSQLEIQEQTLKNISQEIHDNVGQVLSLAKLNLNLAEVDKPVQTQSRIDNALSQVSKAINDLRDLSKSYNSDNIMSQGLVKAIAAELDMVSRAGQHKTFFRVSGPSLQLEPQKELILFRIVQEALHNIIKHAGANTVNVSVNYSDSCLELLVSDDGKGFDMNPVNGNGNSATGLGIRNMQNRASLIGATFEMHSKPGKGAIVKIVLPYQPLQTSSYENGK